MAKFLVVDVESDGPLQGINSMVCFGAVIVDKEGKLDQTFYGQTAPVSNVYDPEALAISGFSRKEHESFPNPAKTMLDFHRWLGSFNCNLTLVSDNNGYDAPWINWYMHKYIGSNILGYSSRRIGDMFAGYLNNPFYKWKKHRKTSHDHNPVNDAKGNAEALLWLYNKGFKLF